MDFRCFCVHGLVELLGALESVFAVHNRLENSFSASSMLLLQYGAFSASVICSKVVDQARPSVTYGENGCIKIDNIDRITKIWMELRNGNCIDLGYREKQPNNMIYELEYFCNLIDAHSSPSNGIHRVFSPCRYLIGPIDICNSHYKSVKSYVQRLGKTDENKEQFFGSCFSPRCIHVHLLSAAAM